MEQQSIGLFYTFTESYFCQANALFILLKLKMACRSVKRWQ